MQTSRILSQPTLVRLMIGIALLVLPIIAWIDFQKGYIFAATVEVAAATALVGMIFLIRPLGIQRSTRVILVVMAILAILSSVEKLESTPNFAWFTIMPFLYIALGGLRLGGFLTVAHFLIIAAFYLAFARDVVESLEGSTWLQVGLAYLTAAGLAISYEHVQRQLRDRLHALADHDPLTGLLNRRGMGKRLKELDSFLKRHQVPVTLALLDIDHFKRVNDEHGHEVGDRVLQELSGELRRIFRSSDYIARWGGEEFLIALTNSDLAASTAILERLRREIADSSAFSVSSLTLSMGVAEWHTSQDLASALSQADRALYGAKHKGRNTLVPAGSADESAAPAAWPATSAKAAG